MGLNNDAPEASNARPAKKMRKMLELSDLEAGKLEKYTVDQLTDAATRILGIKKPPKIKKQLIAVIQEKI